MSVLRKSSVTNIVKFARISLFFAPYEPFLSTFEHFTSKSQQEVIEKSSKNRWKIMKIDQNCVVFKMFSRCNWDFLKMKKHVQSVKKHFCMRGCSSEDLLNSMWTPLKSWKLQKLIDFAKIHETSLKKTLANASEIL